MVSGHAQAVERSSSGTTDGQKITFNIIKSRLGDLMYKITSQKFEDPADGEEKVRARASDPSKPSSLPQNVPLILCQAGSLAICRTARTRTRVRTRAQ